MHQKGFHRLKRRRVLVGTAVAVALTGLVAGWETALASSPAPQSSAVQEDFAAAAKEFKVPLPVLLAVSHEESAWQSHSSGYSTDGGYGLMNLTDVTPSMLGAGGSGAVGRHELANLAAAPALHTLPTAAKLIGVSTSELRTDDRQNLRGGAALLAMYEKKLTGGTPADPAAWFGAVARYSQNTDKTGALRFAHSVFRTLADGATSTTDSGQRVRLTATSVGKPDTGQLNALGLTTGDPAPECPPTVACTFTPAADTNFQSANRPEDRLDVRYIVIHDTESSFDSAVSTFQDPSSGAAANYVMRSSTGAVTQMVPNKDVAFHAGNFWFNMHSIGIEHEGFAADGATWYTEAQYRSTADLVKYLSARYGVPLDREHIIGHDNVPGPNSKLVSGMHFDPGPYWDWTHFMQLLGVSIPQGGTGGVPAIGSAVTITPDFAANKQTIEVCGQPTGDGGAPAPVPSPSTSSGDGGVSAPVPSPSTSSGDGGASAPVPSPSTSCTPQTEASSVLFVRTAPRDDAPLFGDQALHPNGAPGTDQIDDWGSTIVAGQQFVVADVSGDWTAIWYSGTKVWFYNPGGVNTTPAKGVTILKAADGVTAAPVYGQAYPEASEYPAGLTPSTQAPLSMYSVPVGQAYVATSAAVPADDFFAKASGEHPADTVVFGTKKYVTIQYNHRVALLDAADTTVG
ncbi:N-acetylmuramoyl-L-alanine amidase [Streptomyces sp. NPDC006476]|uniref:N-acetylmuramoyl-L-alanine amidase n=1 Tax=Streptomyces sp. NPDC006476 TaxID=3157175 RepID=UPI0033AD48EB